MNLIEAMKEIKRGKAIRYKDWKDGEYIVQRGRIFIKENGSRYIFEIESFEDIYSDNWSVYVNEKETLIKRGKMLNVIMYCQNHLCNNCILFNKNICCGSETKKTELLSSFIKNIDTLSEWDNTLTDKAYKTIKEDTRKDIKCY